MTADDDLRRRLELLKTALAEGKVSVTPEIAVGLEKSLAAVRVNSDGVVDLATVDGRIRSMALAISFFDQRDKAKDAISLSDIQQKYFDIIEHTFGEIYSWMLKKKANPQSVSWMLSEEPTVVEENSKIIPSFIEQLGEFWDACGDIAEYHLQDLQKIKGIFGGDLFPSYERNIASTAGLYLDTIVLTDPFMNSRAMFEIWDKKTAVRFFIKHGLNVLGYKQLALAELVVPIVVVVPFRSSFDESHANFIRKISERDSLKHGSLLFGRQFDSVDGLEEFCRNLDTVESAVSAIARPDRFLVDSEWTGPISDQMDRALTEKMVSFGIDHPGQFLFHQSVGRMRQATDILWKSRDLLGAPLIEAETSWRYLNWKLEYDAALAPNDPVPLHVMKGLQRVASTDMEWLGAIPPSALIEMRREGALEEIREMLSAGIADTSSANPENFFRSADVIFDNLQSAFDQHRQNIKDIRAKGRKFWGHDVGSWIVTGTIELAAAINGAPIFGAAAFIGDQLFDVPKLKEIPSKFKDLRSAQEKHARSPKALLFKHSS